MEICKRPTHQNIVTAQGVYTSKISYNMLQHKIKFNKRHLLTSQHTRTHTHTHTHTHMQTGTRAACTHWYRLVNRKWGLGGGGRKLCSALAWPCSDSICMALRYHGCVQTGCSARSPEVIDHTARTLTTGPDYWFMFEKWLALLRLDRNVLFALPYLLSAFRFLSRHEFSFSGFLSFFPFLFFCLSFLPSCPFLPFFPLCPPAQFDLYGWLSVGSQCWLSSFFYACLSLLVSLWCGFFVAILLFVHTFDYDFDSFAGGGGVGWGWFEYEEEEEERKKERTDEGEEEDDDDNDDDDDDDFFKFLYEHMLSASSRD